MSIAKTSNHESPPPSLDLQEEGAASSGAMRKLQLTIPLTDTTVPGKGSEGESPLIQAEEQRTEVQSDTDEGIVEPWANLLKQNRKARHGLTLDYIPPNL